MKGDRKALFFRFLHTLLLLVLKTPDVKIALEHNKHKHGGGQSKQPRKLLYARLKICKVIEKLKKPYDVASKSCYCAGYKGGFVLAFSAVWANGGKKDKIEHPAQRKNCADGSENIHLFYEHKNKGKHGFSTPPKRLYLHYSRFFGKEKTFFANFAVMCQNGSNKPCCFPGQKRQK